MVAMIRETISYQTVGFQRKRDVLTTMMVTEAPAIIPPDGPHNLASLESLARHLNTLSNSPAIDPPTSKDKLFPYPPGNVSFCL